jgi:hypothetical protein
MTLNPAVLFLIVSLVAQSEETHKKGHCKTDREKSQAFIIAPTK